MAEENVVSLEINNVPQGHLVVGHITYLKCVDNDGKDYWALRQSGLNIMEALGCAKDMLNETGAQVSRMEIPRPEE